MTVLLIVLGVAAWCLLPLSLAIAVGRAFEAADEQAAFERIVRSYDAAGV